ncbi:MAG TPA: PilZ domain-containing protein [Candidatus Acidoferrum sp.]|nr:PilZ domain-containing protein [Candidatus Acidoferrum sp.]
MPPEGVRRSGRIPREIEILLVGSDMEGKVFSETTKTVLISRHGAGIVSAYKLSPEQELILRRLDTNKETEVRVVGQIGAQKNKYTYGMAFLDQSLDFWGVKFPPMTESETQARRVVLECVRCQERETVQQSDLESDVYLVNEGIVRFCKRCGSSTFWKRPSEHATAADAVPLEAIPSPQSASSPESAARDSAPTPVPAAPQINRRKHVRTKVSFKACIRSFDFGDDIVPCEDMSRGGLRFKSRKPYTQAVQIEVAAPYSPGSNNIFVHARIVHVEELKEERRFSCGVEYSAAAKTL